MTHSHLSQHTRAHHAPTTQHLTTYRKQPDIPHLADSSTLLLTNGGAAQVQCETQSKPAGSLTDVPSSTPCSQTSMAQDACRPPSPSHTHACDQTFTTPQPSATCWHVTQARKEAPQLKLRASQPHPLARHMAIHQLPSSRAMLYMLPR